MTQDGRRWRIGQCAFVNRTDMIRLNEKRDRSFSKESSLAGWFDMGAALAWAAIMAAKAWRPSSDVKSKILNYKRLIGKIT